MIAVHKASDYPDEVRAARLTRIAEVEGRSQADVLCAAVDAYAPQVTGDRDFALAAGFPRVDRDSRPISQIPENELLAGFGE